MKMYHAFDYRVFSVSRLWEGEMITQYGLACFDQNNNVLEKIEDISTSKDGAQKIAELLKDQGVSACHFREVIEDIIIDERYFALL